MATLLSAQSSKTFSILLYQCSGYRKGYSRPFFGQTAIVARTAVVPSSHYIASCSGKQKTSPRRPGAEKRSYSYYSTIPILYTLGHTNLATWPLNIFKAEINYDTCRSFWVFPHFQNSGDHFAGFILQVYFLINQDLSIEIRNFKHTRKNLRKIIKKTLILNDALFGTLIPFLKRVARLVPVRSYITEHQAQRRVGAKSSSSETLQSFAMVCSSLQQYHRGPPRRHRLNFAIFSCCQYERDDDVRVVSLLQQSDSDFQTAQLGLFFRTAKLCPVRPQPPSQPPKSHKIQLRIITISSIGVK